MLNLILIGCSTAFLLAVVDPLLDILSMFINNIVLKAFASFFFSLGATLLLEISPYKTVIVTVIAGAFLGSFFLAAAERVATYKPAVINPTRTNN
jgi:hypothetical protein